MCFQRLHVFAGNDPRDAAFRKSPITHDEQPLFFFLFTSLFFTLTIKVRDNNILVFPSAFSPNGRCRRFVHVHPIARKLRQRKRHRSRRPRCRRRCLDKSNAPLYLTFCVGYRRPVANTVTSKDTYHRGGIRQEDTR